MQNLCRHQLGNQWGQRHPGMHDRQRQPGNPGRANRGQAVAGHWPVGEADLPGRHLHSRQQAAQAAKGGVGQIARQGRDLLRRVSLMSSGKRGDQATVSVLPHLLLRASDDVVQSGSNRTGPQDQTGAAQHRQGQTEWRQKPRASGAGSEDDLIGGNTALRSTDPGGAACSGFNGDDRATRPDGGTRSGEQVAGQAGGVDRPFVGKEQTAVGCRDGGFTGGDLPRGKRLNPVVEGEQRLGRGVKSCTRLLPPQASRPNSAGLSQIKIKPVVGVNPGAAEVEMGGRMKEAGVDPAERSPGGCGRGLRRLDHSGAGSCARQPESKGRAGKSGANDDEVLHGRKLAVWAAKVERPRGVRWGGRAVKDRDFVAAVSPDLRVALAQTSDGPGLPHLAGHLGLAMGLALYIGLGGPFWAVLVLVQGVVLVFLFTLEHEATHRTPFASAGLNEWVGRACGFLLFLPFEWFRYFHLAHHRWTNIEGQDPELEGGKPATRRQWVWHVSGLPYWASQVRLIGRLVLGRGMAGYIPEGARRRVVAEARGMAVGYGVVALSLGATQVFLRVWLVPVLLGQPALRLYLLAEHGDCPRVADMFENTRTVFTTALVRFLAWNMPYHVEHHVMPTVPFHRLPELHSLMRAELKVTADGYAAFTRDYLVRRP